VVGGELGVGIGDFESGIAFVAFSIKVGIGIASAGAGEGPVPEFGGDDVGDIASKTVDTDLLPVGHDGIHLFPKIGNGHFGLENGGMFPFSLGALGEVVPVVKFAGFVPAVLAGPPGVLVIARDAAPFLLGGKKAIDLLFEAWEAVVFIVPDDASGGGGGLFFLGIEGGELKGGTVGSGFKVVEVVPREEFVRSVVFTEVALGMDNRGVAAGDVVRYKIDKDLEVLFFGAGEESLELVESFGGIDGVVGADIVVVANGVGATRDAFEEVGIVGGKLNGGVVASSGLAIDARDPDRIEAELLEGGESCVVEIGKFSTTVLFESAIGNASGVGVTEEAGEELVNTDFSSRSGDESCRAGGGFNGEGEEVGQRAIAWSREKVGIGGAEELAPAVFGRDIFESSDNLEFSLRGTPGAWDLEFERAGFTREEFDFGGWVSERGESESVPRAGGESGGGSAEKKEVVGLEWKKERGAGGGFLEGYESGSVKA
jgi:hypothetical protein